MCTNPMDFGAELRGYMRAPAVAQEPISGHMRAPVVAQEPISGYMHAPAVAQEPINATARLQESISNAGKLYSSGLDADFEAVKARMEPIPASDRKEVLGMYKIVKQMHKRCKDVETELQASKAALKNHQGGLQQAAPKIQARPIASKNHQGGLQQAAQKEEIHTCKSCEDLGNKVQSMERSIKLITKSLDSGENENNGLESSVQQITKSLDDYKVENNQLRVALADRETQLTAFDEKIAACQAIVSLASMSPEDLVNRGGISSVMDLLLQAEGSRVQPRSQPMAPSINDKARRSQVRQGDGEQRHPIRAHVQNGGGLRQADELLRSQVHDRSVSVTSTTVPDAVMHGSPRSARESSCSTVPACALIPLRKASIHERSSQLTPESFPRRTTANSDMHYSPPPGGKWTGDAAPSRVGSASDEFRGQAADEQKRNDPANEYANLRTLVIRPNTFNQPGRNDFHSQELLPSYSQDNLHEDPVLIADADDPSQQVFNPKSSWIAKVVNTPIETRALHERPEPANLDTSSRQDDFHDNGNQVWLRNEDFADPSNGRGRSPRRSSRRDQAAEQGDQDECDGRNFKFQGLEPQPSPRDSIAVGRVHEKRDDRISVEDRRQINSFECAVSAPGGLAEVADKNTGKEGKKGISVAGSEHLKVPSARSNPDGSRSSSRSSRESVKLAIRYTARAVSMAAQKCLESAKRPENIGINASLQEVLTSADVSPEGAPPLAPRPSPRMNVVESDQGFSAETEVNKPVLVHSTRSRGECVAESDRGGQVEGEVNKNLRGADASGERLAFSASSSSPAASPRSFSTPLRNANVAEFGGGTVERDRDSLLYQFGDEDLTDMSNQVRLDFKKVLGLDGRLLGFVPKLNLPDRLVGAGAMPNLYSPDRSVGAGVTDPIRSESVRGSCAPTSVRSAANGGNLTGGGSTVSQLVAQRTPRPRVSVGDELRAFRGSIAPVTPRSGNGGGSDPLSDLSPRAHEPQDKRKNPRNFTLSEQGRQAVKDAARSQGNFSGDSLSPFYSQKGFETPLVPSEDIGQFPLTGLDDHFHSLRALAGDEYSTPLPPEKPAEAVTLNDAIGNLNSAMGRKLEAISLDFYLARGKFNELKEAQQQLKDMDVSMALPGGGQIADQLDDLMRAASSVFSEGFGVRPESGGKSGTNPQMGVAPGLPPRVGSETSNSVSGLCQTSVSGLCPECAQIVKDATDELKQFREEKMAADQAAKVIEDCEASRPKLTDVERIVVGKWNPNGTFEVIKDKFTEQLFMVGIDDDLDEIKGAFTLVDDWWEAAMKGVDGEIIGYFRLKLDRENVVLFQRKEEPEDEWDEGTPAYLDSKFRERRPSTVNILEHCTKTAD